MAGELKAKIIQDFTRDIAGRPNEAALLARRAGFGRQGLAEHVL